MLGIMTVAFVYSNKILHAVESDSLAKHPFPFVLTEAMNAVAAEYQIPNPEAIYNHSKNDFWIDIPEWANPLYLIKCEKSNFGHAVVVYETRDDCSDCPKSEKNSCGDGQKLLTFELFVLTNSDGQHLIIDQRDFALLISQLNERTSAKWDYMECPALPLWRPAPNNILPVLKAIYTLNTTFSSDDYDTNLNIIIKKIWGIISVLNKTFKNEEGFIAAALKIPANYGMFAVNTVRQMIRSQGFQRIKEDKLRWGTFFTFFLSIDDAVDLAINSEMALFPYEISISDSLLRLRIYVSMSRAVAKVHEVHDRFLTPHFLAAIWNFTDPVCCLDYSKTTTQMTLVMKAPYNMLLWADFMYLPLHMYQELTANYIRLLQHITKIEQQIPSLNMLYKTIQTPVIYRNLDDNENSQTIIDSHYFVDILKHLSHQMPGKTFMFQNNQYIKFTEDVRKMLLENYERFQASRGYNYLANSLNEKEWYLPVVNRAGQASVIIIILPKYSRAIDQEVYYPLPELLMGSDYEESKMFQNPQLDRLLLPQLTHDDWRVMLFISDINEMRVFSDGSQVYLTIFPYMECIKNLSSESIDKSKFEQTLKHYHEDAIETCYQNIFQKTMDMLEILDITVSDLDLLINPSLVQKKLNTFNLSMFQVGAMSCIGLSLNDPVILLCNCQAIDGPAPVYAPVLIDDISFLKQKAMINKSLTAFRSYQALHEPLYKTLCIGYTTGSSEDDDDDIDNEQHDEIYILFNTEMSEIMPFSLSKIKEARLSHFPTTIMMGMIHLLIESNSQHISPILDQNILYLGRQPNKMRQLFSLLNIFGYVEKDIENKAYSASIIQFDLYFAKEWLNQIYLLNAYKSQLSQLEMYQHASTQSLFMLTFYMQELQYNENAIKTVLCYCLEHFTESIDFDNYETYCQQHIALLLNETPLLLLNKTRLSEDQSERIRCISQAMVLTPRKISEQELIRALNAGCVDVED